MAKDSKKGFAGLSSILSDNESKSKNISLESKTVINESKPENTSLKSKTVIIAVIIFFFLFASVNLYEWDANSPKNQHVTNPDDLKWTFEIDYKNIRYGFFDKTNKYIEDPSRVLNQNGNTLYWELPLIVSHDKTITYIEVVKFSKPTEWIGVDVNVRISEDKRTAKSYWKTEENKLRGTIKLQNDPSGPLTVEVWIRNTTKSEYEYLHTFYYLLLDNNYLN